MLWELEFPKDPGVSKGSPTTSLDKALTHTATYWMIRNCTILQNTHGEMASKRFLPQFKRHS